MIIEKSRLKVICFGMGAIGTYIGGSLANQGAEVVFIEKKDVLQGAGERGIRLIIGNEKIFIPKIEIYSDVHEIIFSKQFDIALLAVKSFDTQNVLDSLYDIKDQFPPILCMQNGVENENLISQKMGAGKVISATITSAIGRSGNGEVKLEKLRGVGIETGHPISQTLIDWFSRAGLRSCGYSSRENMKWSKMLTNILANASSALLNWTPQQIFSNPITFRIEVAQIREALAVMRKLEINIIDLPGTPVISLMAIFRLFPSELSRKLIGIPLAKARGSKMPSFHIDLYAGNPKSEVSYLNGAIVRFGKQVGISTPVNQVLTHTLEALTDGRISKEEFNNQPEKLFRHIKGDI